MAILSGITVVLINKEIVSADPFGKPVTQDKKIEVQNVLVAPVSTDDIVQQLELTGKKAVYQLGIPKGDTHNWENCEVEFFGKRWKTFGFVTEGIEHLIPLRWNKKVMVERYE